MVLPIHIAAGGLALVLGAVALLVRKGGTLHRRSGLGADVRLPAHGGETEQGLARIIREDRR